MSKSKGPRAAELAFGDHVGAGASYVFFICSDFCISRLSSFYFSYFGGGDGSGAVVGHGVDYEIPAIFFFSFLLFVFSVVCIAHGWGGEEVEDGFWIHGRPVLHLFFSFVVLFIFLPFLSCFCPTPFLTGSRRRRAYGSRLEISQFSGFVF
ncbi:hypothetical protein B0T19DRAFT_48156 [Cercophora scortea]|uniref:Transmembrane protein n=1 Tax=Cercophora scortea TaxID=314031 RepID=A0AAE0J560_9PEZI|nr:hypothetical protein B0T19DRAFT_48156 [Cercophora scortea]